jgi:GT2 family glycosyltransferase
MSATRDGMAAADRLGVVVIGRNESAHLADCLRSLARLQGRIIYADSASSDGSAELARDHGARVVHLDPSLKLTPARGRNEGFAALLEHLPGCELVQFVDGDCAVAPNWIEEGAEFLNAHEKTAIVCGQVVEAHPSASVYNWLCGDEWKGDIGEIDACGGNAMIRVAAFQQAGGFRADLVAGEEAELMARMRRCGWTIRRIDRPMVVHDADILKFSDWWKRARRGGYSYANVWWLTRRSGEPLYGAQLRSALLWVIGMPLAVALVSWACRWPAILLLIPVGWLFQTSRIAAQRGLLEPRSWRYAGLMMIAKLAEFAGVMRYIGSRFVPQAEGR